MWWWVGSGDGVTLDKVKTDKLWLVVQAWLHPSGAAAHWGCTSLLPPPALNFQHFKLLLQTLKE